MTKINELTSGDHTIVAKVLNVNKGTTQTGSPYLSFQVNDKSATINCKYWDAVEVTIQSGKVYELEGTLSEFNNKPQFIIQKATVVTDEEIINMFFESAPADLNEIKIELLQFVNKIEDPDVLLIVKEVLSRYENAYFTYPAATQNHHAYLSGLAYHTVSMLKLSDGILRMYPYLDQSLLYGGIILHDFAKVVELSEARSPEYTLTGKLVGHLVLGSEIISGIATELNIDSEKVLLLKHLVISHHGRKEWGSPQRPQIAEAEALHFIDNIDSKFESLRLEFENVEVGEWTKRVPVLDGRSFYKHK